MATAKSTPKAATAASEKEERRGSTVYFEVGLLKRLKKWGIDQDREMSEIVGVAVREYLDREGAPR